MYARLTRILALLVCCYAQRCAAQDVSSNQVVAVRKPAAAERERSSAVGMKTRVVVCPLEPASALARILSVNCERNADCNFLGAEQRCCQKICRRAIDAPLNEPAHQDFLGFRRKCPANGFAERLPVKRCAKDEDCEAVNRICCPDKKDNKLYCRTAAPVWSALPFPQNHDAFRSLAAFVQCQAPPPAVIDIFARPCNNTMDCLPNLCCQEASNKVCRPPKRSLLGLAARATSRFVTG